ncbi:putative disease resistance RPP13-like protein 1 [Typha angustifolia]|uniref:putative disease resistance RPP13-like protein 1 n=1 Tax=Typha angustifolia TaxID=59011 RepID=UPI003C2C7CDC
MAEMAAIGWFISPIIKEMISKARSYLGTQYNWNTRMKDDLKTLETIMAEILFLVSNVERQKITNSDQATSLLQLIREAIYEAADLLDEFDYMLLKAKITSQNKLAALVSSSLDVGKRVFGLDQQQNKLSKALKSLERVKSSVKRLLDVAMLQNTVQLPGIKKRRPTSFLPSQDPFIGRDKLCEKIKRLVESSCNKAESSSSGGVAPIVLPIIGTGGVGKTTLAQHIYNDDQIASKFTKIWICVSNYFDEMKLTKEILTYVSKPKNDFDINNSNYSKLQEELRMNLESEKYFLVLDDVWDDPDPTVGKFEIKDRWMKFLAPLKCNQKGSAILVTTRVGLMAEILCSEKIEIIPLEGLDDNDSWRLLSSHAFSLDTIGTPLMREIEIIGRKIVEKLKSLPLALKAVGAAIECLFPKDWLFEPDWLVQMWVAQGFIHPRDDGTDAAQVGKDHFTDLWNKSFFQTLKRDGKTYYVMHDMMNDLALSVSRRECRRIERDDHGDIPSTVRHLSIAVGLAHRLESMVEMKDLHTLIVFDASSHRWNCSKVSPNDDLFKMVKSVRVLVLNGYCMEQLPKKMNRLINMQHVYFNGTIGEFHVQKKESNILRVLKEIHGKITIKSLGNIESKEEACKARLSNKEHINQLSLEWSSSDHRSYEHEGEVLDGLQPHQNLGALTIKCYGGSRAPFWLDINWLWMLHSLYLYSCKGWRELPPLGHLPFLKILHIISMHAVTQVSSEFYGCGEVKGFPALEELKFEDMPEWVECIGLSDTRLFPSLHDLEICNCPKLKEIPEWLECSGLRSLEIWGCHLILHEQLDKMEGPEFDKFDRIIMLNKDELMRTVIEKFEFRRTGFDICLNITNQTKTEFVQILDALYDYYQSVERIRMSIDRPNPWNQILAAVHAIKAQKKREYTKILKSKQLKFAADWDPNESESWGIRISLETFFKPGWAVTSRIVVGNSELRALLRPSADVKGNHRAPVRTLTPAQVQERRVKGLCFRCDERFTPDHRCVKTTRSIMLIDGQDDPEKELVKEEVDEKLLDVFEEKDMQAKILMHSYSGTVASKTLWVDGLVKKHCVHILIDSESTYNFLDERLLGRI